MSLFGFDDQYAMFDVTPVDNQFILEELPAARGEYVKVYLYGLLACYHPQPGMTMEVLCSELSMSENEVMSAYRYWERKGLVRRVSDNPPSWQYISSKQRALFHMEAQVDTAYVDFCEALHAQFGNDRKLHTKDLDMAYEWVENLHLPVEVVLMMVQHCIQTRGKNFTFQAACKLADRLAAENVQSAEDAEAVFALDEQVESCCRKLLRKLGKRRAPSAPETDMYIKWTGEWGYTFEAIEAACAETTKGEPTFAYLDGILRGMMERHGAAMTSREQVERTREAEADRIAPLKELLRVLNLPGVTVNDETLNIYDDMRAMYPQDVILLAARQCIRTGKTALSDVMALLEAWRSRNLHSADEVSRYIASVGEQDRFIRTLFDFWGYKHGITAADRKLLARWTNEYGYPPEMITYCAEFARGKDKPMVYLQTVLAQFAKDGVRTPDAARAAHEAFNEKQKTAPAAPARQPKVVREQQYTQREYENTQGMSDIMAQHLEELKKNAQ